MESEIKIHGQLLAMNQVIGHLLALEAVRTGVPLADLHSDLVSRTMRHISEVDDPAGIAGLFEASVTAELDSLFVMAGAFFHAMKK